MYTGCWCASAGGLPGNTNTGWPTPWCNPCSFKEGQIRFAVGPRNLVRRKRLEVERRNHRWAAPGVTSGLTLIQGGVDRGTCRALGLGRLQPNGVTTADGASLQHRSVNPDVSPVVLCCCTQNTRILRKIALRKCRHHATRAWTCDA